MQECNWLQALEGEIDSAHAPILHSRLDSKGQVNEWVPKRDLRPTFECIRQDFGMSIAAEANFDEKKLYWRVNQFVMPFYSLVPPQSPFPDLSGHAWVPIDDNHTLCIIFSYHPSEPLLPKTRQNFRRGPQRPRKRPRQPASPVSKRPITVPYSRLLDEVQPRNGVQFDHKGPGDNLVLRFAGPVGSGRCVSKWRVTDI